MNDRWILKNTKTYMPVSEYDFICGLPIESYNLEVKRYRDSGVREIGSKLAMQPRSLAMIVEWISGDGDNRGYYDAMFSGSRHDNLQDLVVVNVNNGERIPALGLGVIAPHDR